jgi:hypothetical protein
MAAFVFSGKPPESSTLTSHEVLFSLLNIFADNRIASDALCPQAAYGPDKGSTHPIALRLGLFDGVIIAGGPVSGPVAGNDFISAGAGETGMGFSSATAIFEQQMMKMINNKMNILSKIL